MPNIDDFEKLITPKTKAILICNPGNPTGYLYSKKEIQKLKKLVLKHDLFLIADEVYREFTYDGQTHLSVMSEVGLEEHAIMIDSVSKRYSMCGARIGCIVSKNKNFMNTAIKFAQARLSPPTYALLASEAALDTPQSYFDEVIEEYVARRNTLITELEKISGVKVANPKGAFYCVAELPVDDADDFARWMLEEFHHNNETLMVAPASGFYSTEGEGKNQDLNIQQNISLKPYNTFGIDVTASRFVFVDSFYSLQEILTQEKDVFLLSGGSNMLLTKNINKLVVHINIKGISIDRENENDVHITVNAGEDWHDFVLWCISQNYGGLENLSLIPGHVGTSPIQNIGAYGVEVKDVITKVEGIDISTTKRVEFSNADCAFEYRNSIFKNELKAKVVITSVS